MQITSPQKLVRKLQTVVIGHDKEVESIAVLLFKHLLCKTAIKQKVKEPQSFHNIMLMGNTGCGKTFLIQSACTLLGLPLIIINCKQISQEGWAGSSFIDLLSQELKNIPTQDIYKSVIFLDEFDKLCMPNESSSGNLSSHLQYSLLKYIEGCKIQYKNTKREFEYVDTTPFCFIFAGNFESVRKEREKLSIGFQNNLDMNITICQELFKFGVVPEIAGRISKIVELQDLTYDQLYDILMNFEGMYNKWQLLLSTYNVDFFLDKDQRYAIINKAIKLKLGARGILSGVQEELDKVLIKHEEIFDKLFVDFPYASEFDQALSIKIDADLKIQNKRG